MPPILWPFSLTAVVGYMVSQRKEKGVAIMEQWIASPCLWLRRTALLHQVHTGNPSVCVCLTAVRPRVCAYFNSVLVWWE